MIPLRHTLPKSAAPLVTYTLVALNVTVFLAQFFLGPRAETLVLLYGFLPIRLTNPEMYGYAAWEVAITLITSLFLHGGFVHLFGNLIYLWVFGGAVEDALGHAKYLLLYLACGVAGSLCHTALFPRSAIPSIGASGSIAGVLGAFFVLRPHARIVTLFPLVVYWAMAEIRAAYFLPIWFFMQFFNGFMALTSARGTQEIAGVAWWAHVGGFVSGALVAFLTRVPWRSTSS
jgi:membrane associated rhomboid family serine protease